MTPDVRHSGGALHVLQILARRKWIILACIVIVPIVAVGLSLMQSDRYRADAEVLLSNQNLASGLTGTDGSVVNQDPERVAATQARLARVPPVAAATLRSAGVTDRTAQEFLEQSSVTADPQSDLLEFAVTDGDPGLARRLATAYGRQFTIYRRQLDTVAVRRARQEVEQRLEELRAEGEGDSALAARLADSEQELRTLEALQTRNAYLVQAADEAVKVQPRPIRAGAIGLGLGVLLGIGLAFLVDALDTRVRSADEIAERLGLPVLGRLPAPPRQVAGRTALVMLEAPGDPRAEAFRVLRTNLDFVTLSRPSRSIMVTSADEEEGKSTTAANLAVAMARGGRRVALVDLDLRRPMLAGFFRLEGRPGVTDLALGRADADEAVHEVQVAGSGGDDAAPGVLHVVPSGPLPPDAGEFVGTSALAGVLERLGREHDVVLIDTPPLLRVGDALKLSGGVDAMVVVSRLGRVRRPMLGELKRTLDLCRAVRLGVVLTGAEAGDGYSGYRSDRAYARSTGR